MNCGSCLYWNTPGEHSSIDICAECRKDPLNVRLTRSGYWCGWYVARVSPPASPSLHDDGLMILSGLLATGHYTDLVGKVPSVRRNAQGDSYAVKDAKALAAEFDK